MFCISYCLYVVFRIYVDLVINCVLMFCSPFPLPSVPLCRQSQTPSLPAWELAISPVPAETLGNSATGLIEGYKRMGERREL